PIQENVVIGLGGQYLYRNPYHPLEYQYLVGDIIKTSDEVYRPGDEISGHFGVDFQIIENTKIMLDGIYTYYWPDRLSDRKIYGAGQKITINFGFVYQFDEKFVSSQILYRYQGKNKLLQELDIELEDKNRNGSQLEINLTYKAISIPNFSIYLLGDGRIYNKNEVNDVGKAFVGGGGFGVDYHVSESWILDFSFKYLGGSITTDLGERRVEGMDIYFGFKYMF
ncbi:hypothetical protein MUP95_08160, partial [bacterium]|nr:hypothetical protein [bacterium]